MTEPSQKDDFVVTNHPFEGLKDGEARLAKAKIALQINRSIRRMGLTQREAAEQLLITQPEVSMLANGRLSGFSFDRLYRCLQALGVDIEIRLKEHSPRDTAGCIYVK